VRAPELVGVTRGWERADEQEVHVASRHVLQLGVGVLPVRGDEHTIDRMEPGLEHGGRQLRAIPRVLGDAWR
jgi:hypothetical protein